MTNARVRGFQYRQEDGTILSESANYAQIKRDLCDEINEFGFYILTYIVVVCILRIFANLSHNILQNSRKMMLRNV